MLKQRVLATLRFFDLQDLPLTLFEIHKYLLADLDTIKQHLGKDWEVMDGNLTARIVSPSLGEILICLEQDCGAEVASHRGYYYLRHRGEKFVDERLHGYLYGIKRERIISKQSRNLRYIPFLRAMGLVGSQALGKHAPDSDIDALIIVEPGFMWLGRFFVTLYFQLAGVRRHGGKIADRFCLNHYLAGPKTLKQDRNVYTASEYAKARPLYQAGTLNEFKEHNAGWIRLFFPNVRPLENTKKPQTRLQYALEQVFRNSLGRWLERIAGNYQRRRIHRDQFVVVEDDELSFHPDNRKAQLFAAFFERQEQDHGEAV